MRRKKWAKMAVALKTCEILHKAGECQEARTRRALATRTACHTVVHVCKYTPLYVHVGRAVWTEFTPRDPRLTQRRVASVVWTSVDRDVFGLRNRLNWCIFLLPERKTLAFVG